MRKGAEVPRPDMFRQTLIFLRQPHCSPIWLSGCLPFQVEIASVSLQMITRVLLG